MSEDVRYGSVRCNHMGSGWQTLTRDAIRGAARLSERRFVCYRLDLSTRGFTGPLCCLSVRPAVILTYRVGGVTVNVKTEYQNRP